MYEGNMGRYLKYGPINPPKTPQQLQEEQTKKMQATQPQLPPNQPQPVDIDRCSIQRWACRCSNQLTSSQTSTDEDECAPRGVISQ